MNSSAQAEAAKKNWKKYVQDNNIKGMSGKTNSDGEVMYRDLEKRSVSFCPDTKNTNWQSSISKRTILS